MSEIMGIISLNESTEKLKELTYTRTIATIPLGGRYRVIDFMLSNMVNSGIVNVAISTEEKARSIYNYVGCGRPWDLERKNGGLHIFNPEASSIDVMQKRGDIEVFKSMLNHIKRSPQEYVLVSRSYMICNVEYREMLEKHKESGADITIMFKKIKNSNGRFIDCDTLNFFGNFEVMSFGKNLGRQEESNISMEMYLMKKDILIGIIEETIQFGNENHLKESILNQVGRLKIYGFSFDGYLACINSLENYYETNVDFLEKDIHNEIFNSDKLIYTMVKDSPPTFYGDDSDVYNSFISSGCIIEGVVENSILSRNVHIEKGAIVRNSILMRDVVINKASSINHMIVEKDVVIGEMKTLSGDRNSPYVIRKDV
ncbi:MAG: glucose-1-phosphate adenylyltransferase subunit GlgD [Clostridiales bacterium]|nr:glucose-1-phosphate adenylyltransferase subunit GlgD [Clostridiales bacterium]